MKALSLTQPWASLMAFGEKRIETRSWSTAYRGPLLIHAAKGFPKWAKEACEEPAFIDVLRCLSAEDLPRGAILCRVELVACVKTTELYKLNSIKFRGAKHETSFGDYSAGRFAWACELKEVFKTPVPAKGALGLWEYEL